MARLVVYILGLSIFTVAALNVDPRNAWFAIASGLAVGFAIPLIDTAIANWHSIRIVSYALRTWRKRVRISASYLFRIKVDNRYLLIKGARFDHYQPVGGVYKAHASSSGVRRKMQVLDDQLLAPDAISEGDLRVRVPGRHLVKFLNWFDTGIGREFDCWREFYEELVATNILSDTNFRVIRYDMLGRHFNPMRFSPWAESQEILIADVVELLPTAEQLAELKGLMTGRDPRILWATEGQIRRLGALDDSPSQTVRIAETATWTLDIAS